LNSQKIGLKSSCDFKLLEKDIRDRLKKTRIELGFKTAKEFAKSKSLKISTYTLHEAGTRSMSIEIIIHYASLLNTEPNWLLTGLGEKFITV